MTTHPPGPPPQAGRVHRGQPHKQQLIMAQLMAQLFIDGLEPRTVSKDTIHATFWDMLDDLYPDAPLADMQPVDWQLIAENGVVLASKLGDMPGDVELENLLQ